MGRLSELGMRQRTSSAGLTIGADPNRSGDIATAWARHAYERRAKLQLNPNKANPHRSQQHDRYPFLLWEQRPGQAEVEHFKLISSIREHLPTTAVAAMRARQGRSEDEPSLVAAMLMPSQPLASNRINLLLYLPCTARPSPLQLFELALGQRTIPLAAGSPLQGRQGSARTSHGTGPTNL